MQKEFFQLLDPSHLKTVSMRELYNTIGGDNYSYANDYETITRLKRFSDSYGICLLFVHRTRKQNSDAKFDMISGTNGLLGVADWALFWIEKQTSNSATLEVSGRDQPNQKIHLNRNPETLVWELERTETELSKLPTELLLENIIGKITIENQVVWRVLSLFYTHFVIIFDMSSFIQMDLCRISAGQSA